MKVLFYLTFFGLFVCLQSYDVLVLQPFGSRSHRNIVTPVVKALGARGHNVTFVSTYSFEDESPANVTEITVSGSTEYFKKLQKLAMDIGPNGFTSNVFRNYYNLQSDVCHKLYASGLLQGWMERTQKFRLVLTDASLNECIIPLWPHLGDSIIILNTATLLPWVARVMNVPTPYAYVPLHIAPFTNQMSFWQRFTNSIIWTACHYLEQMSHRAFYNNIILPNFPKTKPLQEAMDNISLVLVNGDPIFTQPRPTVPTIVNIGGIQCQPAKPIPEGDLKDFIEGSGDDGFILFSFGSVIDGKYVDVDLTSIFLSAFSKIKQRVVWKYESDVPGLPDNVKIVKWLPQQDLLGHPKCKAFFNHGGLLSLQEGVYHAVPQVSLAITVTDQPIYMALTEKYGIAVNIDFFNLSVEIIVDALNKAVYDKDMRANTKKCSEIFRDRPQDPLDVAIYWIEYVMRHKGAPNLRVPSNLNFFQYFLLDVIAAGLFIVGSLIFLIWFTFKVLFRIYYVLFIRYFKHVTLKIKLQ